MIPSKHMLLTEILANHDYLELINSVPEFLKTYDYKELMNTVSKYIINCDYQRQMNTLTELSAARWLGIKALTLYAKDDRFESNLCLLVFFSIDLYPNPTYAYRSFLLDQSVPTLSQGRDR